MIFSLLATLAGWLCLLVAMSQHQRQLLKNKLTPWQQGALRLIGLALIILGAAPLVQMYGMSIGVVVWLMVLTPTAFACMMLLAFASKRVLLNTLFTSLLLCSVSLFFN
mgnify:CR=1 FL=1|tara:strand:+ start:398 stop:724 length:327 start_codon:yes stop_codon:yes gene_type:complete